MRIRNISLRVVSLLVLTFVFVVATAVFTLFDIRMQTQNMEDSLAEEARTFKPKVVFPEPVTNKL